MTGLIGLFTVVVHNSIHCFKVHECSLYYYEACCACDGSLRLLLRRHSPRMRRPSRIQRCRPKVATAATIMMDPAIIMAANIADLAQLSTFSV
jgi:hypothetical protein